MKIFAALQDIARQSASFSLILGTVLYFIFAGVSLLLLLQLGSIIFGLSTTELTNLLQLSPGEDALGLSAFRFLQGGYQILTWGIVGLIMAILISDPWKQWGLDQKLSSLQISLSVFIVFAAIPLAAFVTLNPEHTYLPQFFAHLEELARSTEKQSQQALAAVLSQEGYAALFSNLFVFALIPAFCEEVFFRGFIQKTFSRFMPPHLAVWITAFAFSFIHFQFYGFFTRMLLGGILGYLFVASRSLIPCIIAHFIYNGASIIAVFASRDQTQVSSSMEPPAIPIYLALLSAMAIIGLIHFYFRLALKNE